MKLISRLADPAEWEEYLSYKLDSGHLTGREEEALRDFIAARGWTPVLEEISEGNFPLPEKKLIKKSGTSKKRTVYTYPEKENDVLKLLTFLLLRSFDGIFSDSLYSFRVSRGVARAMGDVLEVRGLSDRYVYKTDISNYFNSIDVERMLEMLLPVLKGEEEIYSLFSMLLREKRVRDGDTVRAEEKGVMAGTPFAVFLANLYLSDMDEAFAGSETFYARYSDDIILMADTGEGLKESREKLVSFLKDKGLEINGEKESFSAPGEGWTFLGISYKDGTVDVSPVSAAKLKDRIRRKARALRRWRARKGATEEQAVKAFIRAMNRKFFRAASSHELTWTRWYFPLINTPDTLKELDSAMQRWIRYVATGKHTKGNYSFRYEKMKELGYVSLVGEWYRYRKEGSGYMPPAVRREKEHTETV